MVTSEESILKRLESLPPDMEVTYAAGKLAALIREDMREHLGLEAVSWVGAREASDRLEIAPRTLRRRAAQWRKQLEDGERPPVRVQKKGEAQNSDWQFALDDIVARQRACQQVNGKGKAPEDQADSSDYDERELEKFLEVA